MVDVDSTAVELAPIRGMLRTYCHALSKRGVEVQDLKQLVEKNIGWSSADAATSDGATIFLPAVVERFETEIENFDFLKVMLTQQAGHIEFGSFDFEFDRPAKLFHDLRPGLHRLAERDRHDHDQAHDHERAVATELSRFFRLFPNRRLALDIFSIVESARVEASVMREYPGIAVAYRDMRARVLALRPETIFLPAREALLEFLIRISLGQRGPMAVPAERVEAAAEIGQLLRWVLTNDGTVEDSAEATVRIYARLASMQNDHLEESRFTTIEDFEVGSNRSTRSSSSKRWEGSLDGEIALPAARSERGYLPPQGVDYRGEFQPELTQLLSQRQGNSREERQSLTAEELAELLRNQRQPRMGKAGEDDAEQDPRTSQMVQNLMRELERRDPRIRLCSFVMSLVVPGGRSQI